jgi:flagellar assembly factor FliW
MDYNLPDFPDLRLGLQARSAADLAILLIVTVRDRVEDTTVNLQGPLVISTQSLLGMQVVVEEYPLRYPLLKPGKE